MSIKKFWNYLWNDDSWHSLVVLIIISFFVIRFMFYPIVGFILGTPFPIVAVVSSSMEHEGTFDDWWRSKCCINTLCTEATTQEYLYRAYAIEKGELQSYTFPHGFDKGDIMILVSANNAKKGDTIVFMGDNPPRPIIHRIVDSNPTGGTFTTKGDHNCKLWPFEQSIKKDTVMGKAIVRIPYLGYVKIVFVEALHFVGVEVLE